MGFLLAVSVRPYHILLWCKAQKARFYEGKRTAHPVGLAMSNVSLVEVLKS